MKLLHKILIINFIGIIGLLISISYVNIPKINNTVFTLEEKAKKLAFERIGKIRYGKNGYIFMFDDNYKIVSHANTNWIGTYMYNKTDTKGNSYARDMIDKTRENGEAFTKYWWLKIKGKEFEKLSYTKLFKPWKIYIGTGVYLDDIKKEVENQKNRLIVKLKGIMGNTPISKTGYIYIFDKNGKMIIHPNKASLENFNTIINKSTGHLLYKDLIKSAQENKPLRYRWNKKDNLEHYKYDKIS